jgi:glycosyltransferase involved in cell wall biosynthesis
MSPKVSICLPNLNTRPFLEERFETIFGQSFQDWELIAYDSYSDDGAWEYIQEHVAREPRMRASQGPREGTPGSWNPCLRQARGEYVYIATSDDTMPPDCLEKMVAALDAHPECDLAHCPLKIIEENGRESGFRWYQEGTFAESSGELFHRPHVRLAPFDGLLHLLGMTVYISITQLLIRRSLFDKIGLFESSWGSFGDFDWDMRASLVANTVHVPDTWGSWRLHSSQASAQAKPPQETKRTMQAMIDHAVTTAEPWLAEPVRRGLKSSWQHYFAEKQEIQSRLSKRQRYAFVCRRLAAGSQAARDYAKWHLGVGDDWAARPVALVRSWLERCGFPEMIKEIPRDSS